MARNSAPVFTMAGAGLAGSLLAVILARKGYQVEVFESRADMRKVDISAGRSINLALANRGIRPLEALGLMDKVTPLLIPMQGRMVHVDGQPSQLQPYGQQAHEVIYSVSRGELNSLLMTEAEQTGRVNIHFEQRITGVDLSSKSLALEHRGRTIARSFDRMIGADGANSIVRDAIMSATDSASSIDVLDHSYKELHIAPNSDNSHKLAKNALHIWPRGEFMMIALPNLDGSYTVTLFMPTRGEISFESLTQTDDILPFFKQYFAAVMPMLENLESSFQANPTGRLATVKCSPWHYQDSALIIGDAAHAIVPFHGQGMNCAFEDCQAIANLFPAATQAEHTDWAELFRLVDKQRKPNSDAIADMALENYIEMRDSVMRPEYLLRKQFAFQLQRWFPERFTPRYGMVMFDDRSYEEAYALGKVHLQLLTELADEVGSVERLT
ncbi:FAD-dependent oxidoreductase [Endozoicomonas sp.]|uniref:FAD-dependent oxidoreductase n=1 Tax=Endozoicomonas sp. TaxID=1892382 RepID=UPI00383A8229